MNEHNTHLMDTIKAFLSWVAAFLGVGTLLGFVNLVVGVVSAVWLLIQLHDHFKYKRPVLKAEYEKLKAERK